MDNEIKIKVNGLKKSFGNLHVLKGVDAEIKAGNAPKESPTR